MNAAEKELVAHLKKAFAKPMLPQNEMELAGPSIDAPSVWEHFLGRTRAELDESTFHQMEDFTYMTVGAVAYYLPALFKILLEQPDHESWFHLYCFLNQVRNSSSNLRELDENQHEAIAEAIDLISNAALSWPSHPWVKAHEGPELASFYRTLAHDA